MRKFIREPEPAFLTDRWEAWGQDWETRRNSSTSANWTWHKIAGVPVNDLLLAPLKHQTQNHCSFCDNFPVSPPSDDTIEHFRPKAQYPREAYHWPNLYYCCRFCQRKIGTFSDLVLRPDAADYEFDRYFRWDYTLGTIEVNLRAAPVDQERARVTIEFYRLNEEHPRNRLRQLRLLSKEPAEPLEEFAYRHFLAA